VLHDLRSQGSEVQYILSALNMRFIEMLSTRDGKKGVVVDVKALYPTLSRLQWEQIEMCHSRMETVCDALKSEGRSEDAIIASLIVGVRNILRGSGTAS